MEISLRCHFGGGGATPQIPAVPKPPLPPNLASAAQQSAANNPRKPAGFGSTILTSPGASLSPGDVQKKTLLGQ